MPSWNSFSYAFGPIVAFIGLGAMVLMLRWAFRRGQSVVERPAKSGKPDDYGMLIPIAAPNNYIQGEMFRQQLANFGIKASLATTTDGPRILVWPGDESNAKTILKKSLQ